MFNFLINAINAIISGLGTALTWVIELLPQSPFNLVNNADVNQYLGGLSWIIPFPQIVVELEFWLTAVVSYYVVMIILRWIKAIG